MISEKYKKTAGILVIIGGLLNLFRMVPVFAKADKMPDFPIKGSQELFEFISPNYSGHLISHVMALMGFLCLIFGILYLLRLYRNSIFPIFRNFLKITGIGGFSLFFIAAIVDGFVLPETLRYYSTNSSVGFVVEMIHNFAINFFRIALLLIFLAIGFHSNLVLHTKEFKKWIGILGIILGHAVVVTYIFGGTGYYWEKPLGGLAIILSNVYWIILGVSIVRKKIEI